MGKLNLGRIFSTEGKDTVKEILKYLGLFKESIETSVKVIDSKTVAIKKLDTATDEYRKTLESLTENQTSQQKKAEETAKAIEHNDKAYDELSKSRQKDIAQLKKLTNEYNKVKESLDKAFGKPKGLDDLNDATKKQGETLADLKKKAKEAKKSFEGTIIDSDENKAVASTIRDLNARIKGLNSSLRNNKRENEQVEGSYDQLQKRLTSARAELKKMPNVFSQNNQQAKVLKKSIFDMTQQLKDFDSEVNQNFRNVGNYKSALKGVEGGFVKMAVSASAMTLGISKIGDAISNGFQSFLTFEDTMAKVKALSGATSSQFKLLEDDAKRLGGTTQFTAGQVASLQEELSKKGFSPEQILASSEAITSLAVATGEDLASSAEVASSALGQFGLSASDTPRVVDVMAKSFSTSALDLEKFRESMKVVAPIAKSANIDIEALTGTLGALANSGISGSVAGTGLRKIISELSTDGSKLSKTLGFTVKSSDDLSKALLQLKKQNIGLGEAQTLVGANAKSTFLALVDNAEGAKKLTEQYRNASGASKEMADVVGGTVLGKIKGMQSAVEALFIELFSGLAPAIKGVIGFITSLFQAIKPAISIIGRWAGLIFTLTGKLLGLLRPLKILLVPIEAMFSLLNSGLDILEEWVTGVSKGSRAMKIASSAQDEYTKSVAKATVGVNKEFDALKKLGVGTLERKKQLDKINDQYKEYLPNLLTEKSTLLDIEKAQRSVISAMKDRIKMQIIEQKQTEILTPVVEEQLKLQGMISGRFKKMGLEGEKVLGALQEMYKANSSEIDIMSGATGKNLDMAKKFFNVIGSGGTKAFSPYKKELMALGLSADDALKLFTLKDPILQFIENTNEADKAIDLLNGSFSDTSKVVGEVVETTGEDAGSGFGKGLKSGVKSAFDLWKEEQEKLKQKIADEKFILENEISLDMDIDMSLIDSKFSTVLEKYEALAKAGITQIGGISIDLLVKTAKELENLESIADSYFDIAEPLEAERKSVEEINAEIERINMKSNLSLELLKNDHLKGLLASDEAYYKQKKELEVKALEDKLKLLEEEGSVGIEYTKLQNQLLELQKKTAETTSALTAEQIKAVDNLNTAVQALFDVQKAQSEDRISMLDKELDRVNSLQQAELALASAEGRAPDFIAIEQKRIDLIKQRQVEEDKLARKQLASAFFNGINANLAQGDNTADAVLKAIRDIGIAQVIGQGFYDGGYTGDVGTKQVASVHATTDGKVHHSHGQEYILNHKATAKIGRENLDLINFGGVGLDFFNTSAPIDYPQHAQILNVNNNSNTFDEKKFARIIKQELKGAISVHNHSADTLGYIDETINGGNKKRLRTFKNTRTRKWGD